VVVRPAVRLAIRLVAVVAVALGDGDAGQEAGCGYGDRRSGDREKLSHGSTS
jgi:hypothetical protein